MDVQPHPPFDSGIDESQAISGSYECDATCGFDSIHVGQEYAFEVSRVAIIEGGSCACEAIEFVDENNTRRDPTGNPEDGVEAFIAFTDVFILHIGWCDAEEAGLVFRSDGSCEHRLACPGWSVQNDSVDGGEAGIFPEQDPVDDFGGLSDCYDGIEAYVEFTGEHNGAQDGTFLFR